MKKELRYCRHWEEDLDISTENSRYVRIELLGNRNRRTPETTQRKTAGTEKNLPEPGNPWRNFACSIVLVRTGGGKSGRLPLFLK